MSDIHAPQSTPDLTILVLNIAPDLEENLIDYLLTFEEIEGFTSFQVHGHGEHHRLSVMEQVSGRRRRIQYEIFLNPEAIPMILAGLAEAVGRDIVYWQLTARNFGRVDS
jgi:hypothetical protein